jgi:DNA-directed RNA polymerase II subunit RPB7
MFFVKELQHVITLHPSFFGPRIKEVLKNQLLHDVEGTCTGQYYIVMVLQVYGISEGKIIPSSGIAEYTIDYQAAVWRPFKGEVVRRSLGFKNLRADLMARWTVSWTKSTFRV